MDRRFIWAIVLMMIIAIAPTFFIEQSPPERGNGGTAVGDSVAVDTVPPQAVAPPTEPTEPAEPVDDSLVPPLPRSGAPADTVLVRSGLYTYGISTEGGRLVAARLDDYRSFAPGDTGAVQLMPPESDLLGLTLVAHRDTIPLHEWHFTPSDTALTVTEPTQLRLTASRGGTDVELIYTFRPDEYRIEVSGRATGVGPNGGFLLVDLGPGLRNTEVDSTEHRRALAIVTKQGGTERLDFADLEPGRPDTVSGPFEWVAVKSKYFVTAIFAFDDTGGRISGVSATAPATAGDDPSTADIELSLPVPATGTFNYLLYAGPMDYDRLTALGHNFDDVNPYGWPGFRTLIHFFAVPVRWLLVWMHETFSLAYGWVLIAFGILVRLVLWPLNQKAMRSSMAMQAIQPQLKAVQEKYKSDPQRQQQEMFKLYREHNVNPLGGCWPMLLPMPVLFALFFVFQNAIELRGVEFLWIPDLARPDPYFIIPIVMGLSMFGVTKVGQLGMEPNQQMKMMLYVMPVMMTFFFWALPSGLNLYYAVSNIVSIPQQYMLAKERRRRDVRAIVEVKTKKPASKSTPAAKRKR